MKNRKIVKEGAREEWEDLKAHWTASSKPKMHDQFEQNREWNKAHPEITCDRCGFASRNEDYFRVEGDEILCDKCRRGMNESSDLDDRDYETAQSMQDFAKKNIPEVRAVVSGSVTGQLCVLLRPDVYIMADQAKEIAKELIQGTGARGYRYAGLNKEDPYIVLVNKSVRMYESGSIRKKIDGKTVKEWYEWLKEENMGCCHLSVGQTAKNDICICMGWHDDGEDGSIAWKIGQQSFRNAMQTDLDVDFDMPYDPETGDVYDTLSYLDDVDPETFDWDGLANEMNSTAQEVYEYACEVDGTDDDDLYEESWIGDKMKAGWEKVKTGAKKFGKAIGDAFNGPFRKGDHIVMKGEDGKEFKGTITKFDLGDKTYEVMLGNAVNEGLQEDVLDMADREDELVWMIQDSFWHLADLGDPDILRELIENCVELEKVKPGRLKEIISDEF